VQSRRSLAIPGRSQKGSRETRRNTQSCCPSPCFRRRTAVIDESDRPQQGDRVVPGASRRRVEPPHRIRGQSSADCAFERNGGQVYPGELGTARLRQDVALVPAPQAYPRTEPAGAAAALFRLGCRNALCHQAVQPAWRVVAHKARKTRVDNRAYPRDSEAGLRYACRQNDAPGRTRCRRHDRALPAQGQSSMQYCDFGSGAAGKTRDRAGRILDLAQARQEGEDVAFSQLERLDDDPGDGVGRIFPR